MQKPRVLLFYALACSSTTLLLLASTSTRGIKREHATNASFFLRSWELKPENDAEFWVSLRFFEKKHLWVDTKFLSDCYKNSIKMKISLKTENEKTFLNPYNLIKTLNFTTLLKKFHSPTGGEIPIIKKKLIERTWNFSVNIFSPLQTRTCFGSNAVHQNKDCNFFFYWRKEISLKSKGVEMSNGIFHLEDNFELHNVNLIIIFCACTSFLLDFIEKRPKGSYESFCKFHSFIRVMTLNTIS